MKKRHNNILFHIIIILLLSIFLISIVNIIIWFIDNNNTKNQLKNIEEITNINEIKDNDNTERIIDENNIDENDPYWGFINTNLINVDFNKLKEKNSDTIGWIQVGGTNVNYPFVQAYDNDFYLSHSFDKNYNQAGWIFMDYRNNKNDFDKNTILYAHGRLDGSMFGSLRRIVTNDWAYDTSNYIVKLSTENENTLWQVFSVYKIPTTNDYLEIYFDNTSFLEFTNKLLKRSKYNFNTNINENDRILTLSTCYDDYNKVVLHAKLIKREKR